MDKVTIYTWLYESGEVGFSLWEAPESYSEWDLDPAKDGGQAEYLLPEGFSLRYNERGVPGIWYRGRYLTHSIENAGGKPSVMLGRDSFPLTPIE